MKDLPGWAIILAIFVPCGMALMVYTYKVPTALPDIEWMWRQVDVASEKVVSREISVPEGETREIASSGYRVWLRRLFDGKEPAPYAAYVVRVEPKRKLFPKKIRPDEGMEVIFIDNTPKSGSGRVQVVSVRKIDLKPDQEELE